MFVDASALIAILAGEPDAAALVARLQQARQRLTSPLALWETTIARSHILDLPLPDAQQAVRDDLALAAIQVVAVPPRVADGAIEAYERYGKGRHPAELTFGGCFAYACSPAYRMPLLFKGDAFPRTDIRPREGPSSGAPPSPEPTTSPRRVSGSPNRRRSRAVERCARSLSAPPQRPGAHFSTDARTGRAREPLQAVEHVGWAARRGVSSRCIRQPGPGGPSRRRDRLRPDAGRPGHISQAGAQPQPMASWMGVSIRGARDHRNGGCRVSSPPPRRLLAQAKKPVPRRPPLRCGLHAGAAPVTSGSPTAIEAAGRG